MPIDKELETDIKKGVKLAKVDGVDMKKRDEEKKKRAAELEKVKAALEKK